MSDEEPVLTPRTNLIQISFRTTLAEELKLLQEEHATTSPASQTDKKNFTLTAQAKLPSLYPLGHELKLPYLRESETNSKVLVPNNQEKEGRDLVRSISDPELNYEA
ncbi:hypothetical protein O181_000580 [Austropuccinia psidii MF-1]|uniref:Uncharacterized protein n=1 Tax=Austropuccinia psidii MF-1 TaxID=1389203 RepID=A0A9Q3B952_9BASI|nr:hypothetical protein [Austropuccinia psidii MF-1]